MDWESLASFFLCTPLYQIARVRVNDNAVRLEQAAFLSADLTRHLQAIGSSGELGGELRRSEQAAVLERIKGMVWQEIQCAGLAQVGVMVAERFGLKVTHIDSDRSGAQFEQHATEPGFEQGSVTFGRMTQDQVSEGSVDMHCGGGPAGIGAAGDIQDFQSRQVGQLPERGSQTTGHLEQDIGHAGFAGYFLSQDIAGIQGFEHF